MSIANCVRCGRMYQKSFGSRVCSECVQAEEEQFRLVRDYVEEHPGCDLVKVAAGTEVDEAVILRFIKQGRLASLGTSAEQLTSECTRCGQSVASGKYCPECMVVMEHSLKSSAQQLLDSAPDPYKQGTRRPEAPFKKRGFDQP